MKVGQKVVAGRERFEVIEEVDFCGFMDGLGGHRHFVAVRVKDGALAVLAVLAEDAGDDGHMTCAVG